MIPIPVGAQIENINLYLRIKALIISIILIINIFENLTTLASNFVQNLIVYLGLFVAGVFGLLLYLCVKKNKLVDLVTHISLVIDVLVIILVLYFHGGIQNSWLFLPTFVVFISSYIFGFHSGLLFALYAFLFVFIMALGQFFNYLPHYPVFNLPEAHWRSFTYIVDYVAGMGVLYFTSAFSIGILNRLAVQRTESIDKYQKKLKELSINETEVKDKIRKAKVEILVRNAELERIQRGSAQRQLKLIDLKKELMDLRSVK